MEAKPANPMVELDESQLAQVAGGQRGSYCVYGANGTVGVNDFTQMVSRPLAAGETCG